VTEPTVQLAIGGMAVAFRIGNTRMRTAVAKRYFGYMRPACSPFLTIECSFTTHAALGREKVRVARDAKGLWRAQRKDFDCRWGAHSGRARLYRSIYAFDGMLRVLLATLAVRHRRILVHAAAAARGNTAFAFVGRSGSGKTTVTRLLRSFRVLNDEIVCLEAQKGRKARVHATPFWGEMGTGPAAPRPYGLEGVFFLEKSRASTCWHRLGKQEALVELLRCLCSFGNDTFLAGKSLEVASEVIHRVPAYRLYFRKDVQVDPAACLRQIAGRAV